MLSVTGSVTRMEEGRRFELVLIVFCRYLKFKQNRSIFIQLLARRKKSHESVIYFSFLIDCNSNCGIKIWFMSDCCNCSIKGKTILNIWTLNVLFNPKLKQNRNCQVGGGILHMGPPNCYRENQLQDSLTNTHAGTETHLI